MDELVKRGMAKWPNVPAVYGWLSLDRRGNWLIKGERISNPLVTDFIGRNCARDDRGCWFFQNGPQRVFLDLDYAPLVYRVAGNGDAPLRMRTHGGQTVERVSGAWLDEEGTLVLETEHGAGTVDDRDLEQLLPHFAGDAGETLSEDALDAGMERLRRGDATTLWLRFGKARVRVGSIASRDVPGRFGFLRRPEPPAGEEVCV